MKYIYIACFRDKNSTAEYHAKQDKSEGEKQNTGYLRNREGEIK